MSTHVTHAIPQPEISQSLTRTPTAAQAPSNHTFARRGSFHVPTEQTTGFFRDEACGSSSQVVTEARRQPGPLKTGTKKDVEEQQTIMLKGQPLRDTTIPSSRRTNPRPKTEGRNASPVFPPTREVQGKQKEETLRPTASSQSRTPLKDPTIWMRPSCCGCSLLCVVPGTLHVFQWCCSRFVDSMSSRDLECLDHAVVDSALEAAHLALY